MGFFAKTQRRARKTFHKAVEHASVFSRKLGHTATRVGAVALKAAPVLAKIGAATGQPEFEAAAGALGTFGVGALGVGAASSSVHSGIEKGRMGDMKGAVGDFKSAKNQAQVAVDDLKSAKNQAFELR
jgi:hypothetical protein